jgi:thioredoxin 1
MSFTADYTDNEPSESEIESMSGPVLLEFGNSWCGYCQRAEPFVKQALSAHAQVRHIRVADASGRRLGRVFGVTLWPTLIFLQDGEEVSRLVRPDTLPPVKRALDQIHASKV